MMKNLAPTKEGQAKTMLICAGPDILPEEVGHWYSPTAVAELLSERTAALQEENVTPQEAAAIAQEPVARSGLLGAIARGWSHPENSHKLMDPELALAIGDEVAKLYAAPQAPADQEALAVMKDVITTGTGISIGGVRINPFDMHLPAPQEPDQEFQIALLKELADIKQTLLATQGRH